MVINLAAYLKNRRIGSTYPCINAKPASKSTKTVKKIQSTLIGKCVTLINAMNFRRHKVKGLIGSTIEMQGTKNYLFTLNI